MYWMYRWSWRRGYTGICSFTRSWNEIKLPKSSQICWFLLLFLLWIYEIKYHTSCLGNIVIVLQYSAVFCSTSNMAHCNITNVAFTMFYCLIIIFGTNSFLPFRPWVGIRDFCKIISFTELCEWVFLASVKHRGGYPLHFHVFLQSVDLSLVTFLFVLQVLLQHGRLCLRIHQLEKELQVNESPKITVLNMEFYQPWKYSCCFILAATLT